GAVYGAFAFAGRLRPSGRPRPGSARPPGRPARTGAATRPRTSRTHVRMEDDLRPTLIFVRTVRRRRFQFGSPSNESNVRIVRSMASELSGRPLRDTRRDRALFVDREQPLQLAEKTLRNGGNVLLVGSRGSGKSSLVRMIAHQLGEADERRPVVVDGRAAGSTPEFLALLRDQLGAWPAVPLGEAASAVASAVVGFANDPQLVLRPSPSETQAL